MSLPCLPQVKKIYMQNRETVIVQERVGNIWKYDREGVRICAAKLPQPKLSGETAGGY